MDERGYWCGAFHCIGKPNVQWEHGAFTGTTNEHKSKAPGQGRNTHEGGAYRRGKFRGTCIREACYQFADIETSSIKRQHQDPDQKTEISKTGNYKRFFRSSDC